MFDGEDKIVGSAPEVEVGVPPGVEVGATAQGLAGGVAGGFSGVMDEEEGEGERPGDLGPRVRQGSVLWLWL